LRDAVYGNVFVDDAYNKDHEGAKKYPERNAILEVIKFHDTQTEKIESETD
jgi:hypothetical protein